jgi:xylulokinase
MAEYPQVVLAIDLGGTSLRAALVTADGTIAALASRPHRTEAEADPRQWWQELQDCAAELPVQNVAGIGLSGFTRSQVLVDAAGTPVRPAQCFPDGRAEAEAQQLAGEAAGTWMDMTAFHPLARLRWVARNDPDAFAKARFVLQPKDWLGMRLTGRAASDRIANSRAIDRATGSPTTAPLQRAGLDPSLLPELLDPCELLGRVRNWPALECLPVFTGSMDTWVATIGAGVGKAGDAYLVSGTTDAGGVLTAIPQPSPGLVTLPWGPGLFHTGGPSGAGADCAAWAGEVLGLHDAVALANLAARANADEPPIFLPALSGTRAPHWQPGARGALLGLRRDHRPADIARAVLEGVAFADRELLGELPFSRLVISGGGARSDLWCQIRADVLERPILRAQGETGLIGAAAIAWTGLGRFPSLGAAQRAMCRHDRLFTPSDDRGPVERYALFKRAQLACMALAPMSEPS